MNKHPPAPVTEGARREAVVVPCEPTHAMNQRGVDSLRADLDIGRKHQSRSLERAARNCYVTMLSAAHRPPDRVQPERVEEHVPNAEFCPHCNPCRNSLAFAKAERYAETADAVLRGLMLYLSAGGAHGTEWIDTKQADKAIRWGIDHMLKCEFNRGQTLAKTAPPTDASGGVTDEQLCSEIEKSLRSYRAQHQKYAHGDHVQLVDILTPSNEATIELGKDELRLLADHIFRDVKDALEAADRARKPGYRQVTLEDAKKLHEDFVAACGMRLVTSPVEATMMALRSINAVIPEHAPGGAGVKE